MQTITALQYQKKNAERVNVYLDGEFAFGLNALDAATLRQGQQLSDDDIAALKAKDSVVKAVNKGIDLLSYRPRSTQEIRQALADKDISALVIDDAIDQLQALGYLDDRAFARFWVENRTSFKPRGAHALRYELRQKGVSDTVIETVITETEAFDEDDAAYRAAQGRIRRLTGRTQHEFKQKMASFLQRRGFGYDIINRTLNQLIEEIEADTPDFFAPADSDMDFGY